MSKKLFGITVIDGTPYIRNVFFYDGDIDISNNKILNITKIIKVDDKESLIDSTKNITFENENIIHKYDGNFHVFVNEDINKGYYTEGAVSFDNNSITSDKKFKEGFSIETILKVLNNIPSEVSALKQEIPIVAELNKGQNEETNIKSFNDIEQIIGKDTERYNNLKEILYKKLMRLKKIHNISDTEYKSESKNENALEDGNNNFEATAENKNINNGKNQKKPNQKGGTNDILEYRFKEIASSFIEIIDLFMTVPSIFKINSLPVDNLNKLFSDRISISFKDDKDQTINEKNIKPLFLDIMKLIYIDYSEIKDSKLLKILENKYKNNIINGDNENGKQIFNDSDNKNLFFLHITKFKYLLEYYVTNYDQLSLSDIDTVNIITWLYVSIDNISEGLDKAIDNIEILELPNNISTFKKPLDAIINSINSDKIITYLKITNHNNASSEYNKRFEIHLNNDPHKNIALVKYMNDDYMYYDNDNSIQSFKTKLLEMQNQDKRKNIIKEISSAYNIFVDNINAENIIILKVSSAVMNKETNTQKQKTTAKNINDYANTIKTKINSNRIDFNKFENFNNKFVENIKKITESIENIMKITKNENNTKAATEMLNIIKRTKENILNSIKTLNELNNINNYNIIGDTFDIKKYDTEYLFGKFTKIFEPSLNNNNIADQMETIKQKAIKGIPIFILGYGASGAGKTSSLIYNNKGTSDAEKQGILKHLCNYFAMQGYKELTIKTKEFFVSDDNNLKKFENTCDVSGNDIICKDEIKFTFDDETTQFVTNQYEHTNIHKYRSKESTIEFNKKTLGETLIHLIDTDRFVKATTNNPNSSRSHVLVFVNIKKTDDNNANDINLIVGDFAGVENKFYCHDVNTLVKFLNIKRDDKEAKQYYSTESIKYDNMNIIYGGNTDCSDKYQELYPIYDFSEPVIRESMKSSIINDNVLKNVLNNLLIENTGLNTLNDNSVTYNLLRNNDTIETIKKNYDKYDQLLNNILNYENYKKDFFYKMILGIDISNNIIKNDDNTDEYLNLYVDDMTNVIIEMCKLILLLAEQNSDKYRFAKLFDGYKNDNRFSDDFYNVLMYGNKKINGDEILKNIKLPVNDEKILTTIKGIYEKFLINFTKTEENKSLLKSEWYKIGSIKKYIENNKNQIKTFIKKQIDDMYNNNNKNVNYTFYRSYKNIPDSQKYESMPIEFELNSSIITELFNLYNNDMTKLIKNWGLNIDINNNAEKDKIRELLKIYDHIYEIIYETHCRLDYGKQICISRLAEGNFINQSLRDVRKTIKEIMIEKNKNTIYNSPEFIDVCLDTYCPTHESCFEQKSESAETENDDINSIPSKIFYEICAELNYKTKTQFYKDIIVSVLCVFNISKQANNPPPIPYIDINRFKQLFYLEIIKKYGNSGEIILEKDKIMSLISQFDKIVAEINFFNTKVGDLLEKDEYINTKKIIETLSRESNKPEIILNESNRKTIEDFINLIDNSNAVSAIGTLEFVDQIAKFNTVNTICSNNSPYLNEKNIELVNNLQVLYKK
jgi:hypothetical protein